MDFKRLRYFLAVAEELHFGRAAERLRMSQPPLSQQIKVLEDELGLQLFERTKRKVQLTPSGELLLLESRSLLAHAERVRRVMREAGSGSIGHVSIACVPSALYEALPPVAAACREKYPGIVLSLTEAHTGDILAQVRDGRVDIGFVWADRVKPPLALHHVQTQPFVVALPVSLPLARRKKVRLKDLAGVSLVMAARASTPQHYDRVIASFERAGITPQIECEAASVLSQLGFVASAFGVAIVPAYVRAFAIKGVAFAELSDSIEAVPISLVWNERELSPQAVQVRQLALGS